MTAVPVPDEKSARPIARDWLARAQRFGDHVAVTDSAVTATAAVGLGYAVLALVDEIGGLRKDLAEHLNELFGEIDSVYRAILGGFDTLTYSLPGPR